MKEWLRGLDQAVVRRWMVIGAAGLIMVLLANMILQPPQIQPVSATPPPTVTQTPGSADALLAYESSLDQEVAQALEAVQGAGHVRVAITLGGSPAHQYVLNNTQSKDVTQSKDAQGGTQIQTTQQSSSTLAAGSGSQPVLMNETGPQVVGVLVVATGAGSAVVRDDIFQATATLLGIPQYKVVVLP